MRNNMKKQIRKSVVVMLLIAMVCPSITVEAKQLTKQDAKVVVIDPGCQRKANTKKEPIGPGAFKTTEQSPAGEIGYDTGYPEYELNLQISLKLQNILKEQGYKVVLTRTENDVDISNSGRAMIANTSEADIFVVINTGESDVPSVVCQSEDNPYTYGNYTDSRLLSDAILGSVAQTTESKMDDVKENDEKTVINWSQVPTAIVEVGSLSNEQDEKNLVTDIYQQKMAQGIANGIDSYFTQK